MKIDPKHNVIPWDHTLAVGGITIDLLSPVEAESVPMPPHDQVTRVDLERAVVGLVPACARDVIKHLELSAGTLADILGQYQVLARVWSDARQQLAEVVARRELQPVAERIGRQLVAPAPAASSSAKPADSHASRAQRQAATGEAMKFDLKPGGPLPQVLQAEHERTMRIEQAQAERDAASKAPQSPVDGPSEAEADRAKRERTEQIQKAEAEQAKRDAAWKAAAGPDEAASNTPRCPVDGPSKTEDVATTSTPAASAEGN